jgi:rhodanese-related sulfurtransferase
MKLVAKARQSVNEVTWQQIEQDDPETYFLVDVREPHEFAENNAPHAFNVPRGLLEFSIQNHPELKHLDTEALLNARYFLLCGTGGRSALAARSMEELGFSNVYSVAGGLNNQP